MKLQLIAIVLCFLLTAIQCHGRSKIKSDKVIRHKDSTDNDEKPELHSKFEVTHLCQKSNKIHKTLQKICKRIIKQAKKKQKQMEKRCSCSVADPICWSSCPQ